MRGYDDVPIANRTNLGTTFVTFFYFFDTFPMKILKKYCFDIVS